MLRAEHVPFDGAVDPPRLAPGDEIRVASYNVHRWTGVAGGSRYQPELAAAVLAELDAEVIALQEVLRPEGDEDPLFAIARDLGLHVAFATTRIHRHGELGNAILARRPMAAVYTVDLSFGRLEQRSAVVANFHGETDDVAFIATHLALVDRTRGRQVRSLLDHPRLQGPAVLLGDMNAWRRCAATRELDRAFTTRHDNQAWPPTYPAPRPVLALDRVYARSATVAALSAHASTAARQASDHLPVVGTVVLGGA